MIIFAQKMVEKVINIFNMSRPATKHLHCFMQACSLLPCGAEISTASFIFTAHDDNAE